MPKEREEESSVRPKESESIAKERSRQRKVRRTFKMLREVWLNMGVEKLNTHKDIIIKALLNSSVTGMFIKRMVARHGFKLQKLERPIMVRNIDKTNNSRRAITH